jgi:hypothetical protein
MQSTETVSKKYKLRIKLFCRWFSSESRQLFHMRLMTSSALNWMSYASQYGLDRLHQIHMAWFDYRRTIKIKLDAFVLLKKRRLLMHWFTHKITGEKKKTLRRVLNWAAKRTSISN